MATRWCFDNVDAGLFFFPSLNGFLIAETVINHQGGTNKNSRISDVKRRPVVIADKKIEKVDHMTQRDAVVQIPQRTAENETQ